MRWVWATIALGTVACATPPPPPVVQPLYKDGVMQRALTPKEAERYLMQAVPKFDVCYRREQLNLVSKLSRYVFEVMVPVDGSKPAIEVLQDTVPDQVTLRGCLIEAIEQIGFPAHIGKPIKMKVPIEGG